MHTGLASSSDGIRTAIYYLGVLRYPAQQGPMSRVSHTSTISGASICMGLVYAYNANQRPSDIQFLGWILPAVRKCIAQKDIQWHVLFHLLSQPYYWDKKINLLAKVMEQRWVAKGHLQGIASCPAWTINTTTCESGRDFRFPSTKMGEWGPSYVMHLSFALSYAVATSAGLLVLIGPYKLKTDKYTQTDVTGTITVQPRDRVLHLWDGGAYDDMGLGPLFITEQDGGLHGNINYLIVFNAPGNIERKTRRYSFFIENLRRLLDINMDQAESLRSQEVIDFFCRYHSGVYLRIGATVRETMQHCALPEEQRDAWIHSSMKEAGVQRAADHKTTLEKVSASGYDAILQHGYEIAKASLSCFENIAQVCVFPLTQTPGYAYSEVSKEREALEKGIAMYRNRYDDNCEYDNHDSCHGFDEPEAGWDCGCRCDRDSDDSRSAEDEQGFVQEYYNYSNNGGSACDCGCDCNRSPRPLRPYPGIGPTGPMGPRDPRGLQGLRGLQGPQGKEGLRGLRGPQGDTGPQGVAGVQDLTGSTGPQGVPGERDVAGARGATGTQGPQGPQGATGPAGESALLVQLTSVSFQSFTDKRSYAQDTLVFGIGTIQSGSTISENHQGVTVGYAETYVVQFGCLLASQLCEGDAVALKLNSSMIIEEPRLPMLCEGSFVQGSCIVELGEGDSLYMVSDTSQGVDVCNFNSTVNAYLIVYQIN